MLFRLLVSLALVAALALSSHADDKSPAPDKLRKLAEEAMKKAEVKDARVAETEHLIVATVLPEAKAKALADGLEKVFVQAAKMLKLEPAETKGQVSVFTFADLDNYRQFQRSVLKQRPNEDETASSDVKRDDPYIAVSARRSDKSPNFELLAGNEISRAMLAKKGGNAKLTEWMKDGFAKAVVWRLNPATAMTERSFVRGMAPALKKGAKAPWVVDKAWSGTGKEKDLVAASLMDYFTAGAGAEKFGNILSGLTPTDAVATPMFLEALKGADWPVEDLDRAWRDWVSKGSQAAVAK